MLFTPADPLDAPTGHAGYLAGRYRDGAYSDEWTDVSRCAENTFVGYAAVCSCGWRGPAQPATPAGRLGCWRTWAHTHLRAIRADGPIIPAQRPPTDEERTHRTGPDGPLILR